MEIDWQGLIGKLEEAGWSRKSIAEYCRVPYTTLCDIANGSSKAPRGILAVRLHAMQGLKPSVREAA